jgi:phage terminase small subunit
LGDKAGVEAADVIAEYKKLAFANLEDYVKIDANGEPYVDLSGMTREQAAALSGAEMVETVTEGEESVRRTKRTKLRFHSKQAALDALAKHLGLFNDESKEQKISLNIIMFGDKAEKT